MAKLKPKWVCELKDVFTSFVVLQVACGAQAAGLDQVYSSVCVLAALSRESHHLEGPATLEMKQSRHLCLGK